MPYQVAAAVSLHDVECRHLRPDLFGWYRTSHRISACNSSDVTPLIDTINGTALAPACRLARVDRTLKGYELATAVGLPCYIGLGQLRRQRHYRFRRRLRLFGSRHDSWPKRTLRGEDHPRKRVLPFDVKNVDAAPYAPAMDCGSS